MHSNEDLNALLVATHINVMRVKRIVCGLDTFRCVSLLLSFAVLVFVFQHSISQLRMRYSNAVTGITHVEYNENVCIALNLTHII